MLEPSIWDNLEARVQQTGGLKGALGSTRQSLETELFEQYSDDEDLCADAIDQAAEMYPEMFVSESKYEHETYGVHLISFFFNPKNEIWMFIPMLGRFEPDNQDIWSK